MCFDYWLIWVAAAAADNEKSIFSVYHTHKILRHYLYRIKREKKIAERKSNLGKFTSLRSSQNEFWTMRRMANPKRDRLIFSIFLSILSFNIVIITWTHCTYMCSISILCIDHHRFNSLKFLFMYLYKLYGRSYTKVFAIKFFVIKRIETYFTDSREKLNGTGQLGTGSMPLNRKIMDTFNVSSIKKTRKEKEKMNVKKWNFDSKIGKTGHKLKWRVKLWRTYHRKRFIWKNNTDIMKSFTV